MRLIPRLGRVKQGATSGNSFLNLVDGADDAVFNYNATFVAGAGFVCGITTSQRIVLPATAKLTGYNAGFVFAIWTAPDSQTQISSPIAGWFSGAVGSETGYGLRFNSGTTYRAVVGSTAASFSLTASTRNQIVMARCSDGADGYLAAFFRNGVLLSSVAMGDFTQPASPPADVAIGDVASGSTGYYLGKVGRSWMTKKLYTLSELTALVEKDWALNSVRFA